MKNSKILILLLAILMIVSISAVSAEDIADSELSLAQDDSTPLEVDEAIDNIQAEDETPQSVETGNNFTSLQTLIDEEGAKEITLDKDYERVAGEKDIVINKDYTIDGQGKYSIYAAESGRIFNVTADNTLTLKGLTLIGGNVNGNGGAVYSEGNLKLINCTFTNNVASSLGGAVFVNGTATIEGCVFKENTALQGTVYNQNEKLTVKDTLFDNNTAKGDSGGAMTGCGAAIYTYAPLEVYNSNFTSNHAEYDGGAIFYRDNEDDAAGVLDNCRFENNVADGACGAVYVDGYDKCNFNVTTTKFINNTNKASHYDTEKFTAALYFKGSNLRVANTEFASNKGKKNSAIYAVGEAGLLTIDNSQFVENNADDTTVAIYKNAKLTNVRFVSNSGYSDRVAIEIANSGVNVEIKDSTFIDNGDSTEYSIWNEATLKVENNTISNGIGGPGTVIKQNSSITINPIDNVEYGSPVVVSYSIENRSSNVTVTVGIKNGGIVKPIDYAVVDIENDKVTITNLTVGQYAINIVNNEDNNIAEKSESAVFNVTKATPVFDVNVTVDKEGQIVVAVKTNEDATGSVFIKIDNDEEDETINDGFVNYEKLSVKGTHNVTVTYEGDEKYAEASKNFTVVLDKEVPAIEIISCDVNEYGQIVVNANITKGVTGNVTFLFINANTSKNMTVPIEIGENGTIEYDENTPFEKGFYTISIRYDGNDDYYAVEYVAPFVDVNKTAIVPGEPVVVVNGGEVNVTFDLGVNATGKVHVVYPSGYEENITIENGTVKFYSVFQDQGNMTLVFDYDGDDNYYGFYEYYVDFFIKYDSELKANTTVSPEGQIIIDATVNKNVTGELTFIIKNETEAVVVNETVPIYMGFAILDNIYLPKGYYTTEVIFAGDDYYEAAEYALGEANITKEVPVIEIISRGVNEYGQIVINANITKGITGNVTFLFKNVDTSKNMTVPIEIGENGTIEFDELTPFEKGFYTIGISYAGDNNYYEAYESTYVNVNKTAPSMDVVADVNAYGIIEVSVTLNKNATGNVTVLVIKDGEEDPYYNYTDALENGSAKFYELTPAPKGSYQVYVDYEGNDEYYSAYQHNIPVDVNKTAVTPGEATVVVNGGTVNVTFDLGVNATGIVHVGYPSGYVDNITIENGTVKFYDTFQEQGNLTLIFDYDGDDNYYGFYEYFVDFFIKVDPELNVNTTVSSYGWIEIDATVNANVTGVLTFIIRNETGAVVDNRTKSINGGFAMIVSDNLPKGYYTTEVIFAGDDYYEAAEYAVGEANITKEVPEISYTVDVVANQAKITFKLPVDTEGNVTVLLMNYDSNVTLPISNGTVVLDEIFDNGNQTVMLLYDGDDKYYAELEYVDFFVKASSFISAKDVSVVYQNNGKVTVTLTDNNDKKGNNPIANAEVVVTVNGKNYKGTTDAKGIATVTVPAKLVPKTYTAKVSYAGTNTTIGDTSEFKFIVKKATPKVTAKKKTFKKSKKVKKYTITLKDNKGKAIKKAKVTIKVGKKTFKAKTNAKGKAVFKLKKLTKKAKYNAKVTYKGNKYFKKVTKKVKITIK